MDTSAVIEVSAEQKDYPIDSALLTGEAGGGVQPNRELKPSGSCSIEPQRLIEKQTELPARGISLMVLRRHFLACARLRTRDFGWFFSLTLPRPTHCQSHCRSHLWLPSDYHFC